MVTELHDERCEASLIFVTRCREHMEALKAIDILKAELSDWEATGMTISLMEVKETSSF